MSIVSTVGNAVSSFSTGVKKHFIDPVVNHAKSAYLRYSPSIVYAASAIALTAGALYLAPYQKGKTLPLALPVVVCGYQAASMLTIKSAIFAKEELRINANNKALKKLEKEINAAAPQNSPLVVVFHCESDHNGAFKAERTALRSLKGSCRVKVIPIAGPYEIEGHLESISKKHNIAHAVLAAHGDVEYIAFRMDRLFGSSLGLLTRADVKPTLFTKVNPKGTLLIPSCSTGAPGGIASHIARVIPQQVQAPSEIGISGLTWVILDKNQRITLLALNPNFKVITNTFYGKQSSPLFPSNQNELDLQHLEETATASNDRALMTYAIYNYAHSGRISETIRCLKIGRELELIPDLQGPVFQVERLITKAAQAIMPKASVELDADEDGISQ